MTPIKRDFNLGSEILCPCQFEHMGAPRLETFIFALCTGVEVLVRVRREELSSAPRMYQTDGNCGISPFELMKVSTMTFGTRVATVCPFV